MPWSTSDWNPSNWFGGQNNLTSSVGTGSSMAGADWSAMQQAGYGVPSTDASLYNNTTGDVLGSGMNWAGLSSGLSNLSKSLGGGSSGSSSDSMQGSRTVASSTAQGGMSPAGAGGGASALASADQARNQLAQYLILAAMQGKGRGGGGKGLLG